MKLQTEAVAILPLEAFRDHRLTLIQLRVLGAIFSWRNRDTSVASVYRDQLAQRSGYSEGRISNATNALVKLGWLRKEGVGGRGIATRYQVMVPDIQQAETVPDPGMVSTAKTMPDPETVSGSVTVSGSGTVLSPKPCPIRAENGARSGHTLQSNHRKAEARSKEKAARVTAHACPEDVSETVWADWLALRKAKHAPVSETVVNRARIEAGKAAMPFEEFLAEWCERGSQGLKAEWLRGRDNARGPPRPPVAQQFADKTYTGTPDDELPTFLQPSRNGAPDLPEARRV